MSPRGVAIPDVEAQLFDAAERILLRDGPPGLTSRAITAEAGLAKGILHNHYHDLDGFLVALLIDRGRRVAARLARLVERAGSGTVAANVTEAGLSLTQTASALIDLVRARPELGRRVREANRAGRTGFLPIEASLAAYLEAERRLGRIARDAETDILALALFGALHHVFQTDAVREADVADRVRRLVAAILAGSRPGPGRDGRDEVGKPPSGG
jgi:AcrR family transcriptional regulator